MKDNGAVFLGLAIFLDYDQVEILKDQKFQSFYYNIRENQFRHMLVKVIGLQCSKLLIIH